MKVILASVVLLVASASNLRALSQEGPPDDEKDGCAGQDRFDVIMCNSHMCTDCILSWCTETCQAWQLEFPGCRCADWPESRTSFSTGDFAGKGGFGDAGDYGQKASE